MESCKDCNRGIKWTCIHKIMELYKLFSTIHVHVLPNFNDHTCTCTVLYMYFMHTIPERFEFSFQPSLFVLKTQQRHAVLHKTKRLVV